MNPLPQYAPPLLGLNINDPESTAPIWPRCLAYLIGTANYTHGAVNPSRRLLVAPYLTLCQTEYSGIAGSAPLTPRFT